MARVADSLTLVGVQVKGFIDVASPRVQNVVEMP